MFMEYIPLKKIYYTDINNFDTEYNNRFQAPSAKHFKIKIKEYNRNKSFPAFICYTEETTQLTEKIYKQFLSYLKIKNSVPNILLRQFILSCLVNEIQSTNDIEGVYSTKRQIRAVLENPTTTNGAPHLKSIIDKYQKIISHKNIPFKKCADIRKFYDTFVLDEVLSEHPENKPDGKLFRKESVSVESQTGKIFHQGLYPEEILTNAMSEALSILNDANMPALIRISVFHYLFGYIHPFYDGNGRTARFITSYYLSKEFDEIIALRLSVIIKKNKNFYYKLFQNTTNAFNKGDLSIFVIQFMELLSQAFTDTINILNKKRTQLKLYSDKLNQIIKKDNVTLQIYYILLQATFFYGEGATIKEIQNTINRSRVTIQTRIDQMPSDHLLINKRHKPYRYKLNMLILKN